MFIIVMMSALLQFCLVLFYIHKFFKNKKSLKKDKCS